MNTRSWLQKVLGGALLALGLTPAASAQSARAHGPAWLDWESPEGCPERAAVYERAREAAGFAPELGRFERVRGVVLKQPSGFQLTLQFFEASAQSSRTIEARDCGDLQGAAAVAIALALGNPAPRAMEAQEASPATAPQPGPELSARETSEAPARAAALGWSWTAAGLVDLGSVSRPSVGLGATARVRIRALEIGLSGSWLPEAQRKVRAGESVQFGLAAAGPLVCWRWQGLLEPAVCGALELGRLSADGAGLSQNQRQFSPGWVAPGLALELRQRLSRVWGLELRAEGLRPLSRQRYTVNGSESVYESPEAVLRLSLGVSGTIGGGGPQASE